MPPKSRQNMKKPNNSRHAKSQKHQQTVKKNIKKLALETDFESQTVDHSVGENMKNIHENETIESKKEEINEEESSKNKILRSEKTKIILRKLFDQILPKIPPKNQFEFEHILENGTNNEIYAYGNKFARVNFKPMKFQCFLKSLKQTLETENESQTVFEPIQQTNNKSIKEFVLNSEKDYLFELLDYEKEKSKICQDLKLSYEAQNNQFGRYIKYMENLGAESKILKIQILNQYQKKQEQTDKHNFRIMSDLNCILYDTHSISTQNFIKDSKSQIVQNKQKNINSNPKQTPKSQIYQDQH
ncbi:hypothetical protein TRFO_13312 [Tritrichomonas foetus]|uniref:Uncharacterized protein n=1 Tax=Tritrichomonas foetus TaxID=1144522 RepID=A0A1J4KYG5_9EUKA|nr:hypothetical protein TRFO_13312 [Tritrichomonas foetus]|eukprot:OHT16299.1 hypothetical protein TRFO_13312 [Tritrichomonas foetus]